MFFLICGVGHCGTQWLGEFLERPGDGIACGHEQKFSLVPQVEDYTWPWMADLRYSLEHGFDDRYQPYIDAMRQRQQEVAVVGDAHSWEPFLVPALSERLPVSRIIYLVRNGIQNVHSLYYHNTSIGRRSWFYERYLRIYADMMGLDWSGLDDWSRWCAWWAANPRIAHQLSATAEIDLVRLEDLTTEPQQLVDLTKRLQHLSLASVAEAAEYAERDVNRKISGRRDPDYLWSTWTDHQRATFERICGETMREYGYSIPESDDE